ncbi:hypothetical protein IQ266_27520 [filamentous cyanobacterium LEGE 11480]|uniref:Uncharacterized protein n=1 Tax=Romeriopsis navalis LEGE 11480 TaxID=2777977 RepID=A0A928Z662_9CYAN|nr:hypothetical protein [Romeriopsis navalis]MBE9033484.1 hypothetical protein [Romeriopsis navalis LEGE 11480]
MSKVSDVGSNYPGVVTSTKPVALTQLDAYLSGVLRSDKAAKRLIKQIFGQATL